MNLADVEGKSASGAAVSGTDTRLTGRWLIIARVAWLVLVLPSLGLFVVSLPVYYQQLQRACVNLATCSLNGALIAQGLQALPSIGFSVSGYATFYMIFFAVLAFLWSAVGFLIFWRRSNDWLALLAAFFLVMFNVTISGNPPYALALAYPAFALPLGLVDLLGQTALGVFLLLFPNGRLLPRWMGAILLLYLSYVFLSSFPSPASSFATNWPGGLNLLVLVVPLAATIYSQIYRYRRVSTPVQRQQTKWIVLGVAASVGFVIGLFVISSLAALVPHFITPTSTIVVDEVWAILTPIAFLLIPLSIGFSILRYRLYDIDLLINRTLVYGTLTVMLALIYFGSIIGLQALLRGIIHANNSVAIVVSTLLIAALFQPLRHRIQAMIDRRFYRRKYDAARTIAAFSATLRNEVDLTHLSEHLVAVVEETMQPKSISLWLRDPASKHPRPDHM
jgi:hypothetical protein